MHPIGRVIVIALLGASLIGCNAAGSRYFTQGIGTDLSSSDVVNQTNLQEIYLDNICRQAGLPTIETQSGASCAIDAINADAWTTFVQAGLNDIDQRCDGYLEWLDNRRRSSAPILQEMADAGTAADLILTAAKVGPGPIAIVAASFGLLRSSFTNFNSRLLLEVDHSTVQAIVLTKQNEFRKGLLGKTIDNRPAAIYALRSYMRLCMPFTIETEINTTIATFERAGGAALDRRPKLIDPGLIKGLTVTDVRSPLPTPAPIKRNPPAQDDPRFTPVEVNLSKFDISNFQKSLCVSAVTGKLGVRGSETRTKIRAYLIAQNAKGSADASDVLTTKGERDVLSDLTGDPVSGPGLCASPSH